MQRQLRSALRRLVRRPGGFLVQVLSVAAGLAFATTVFLFGDALFLARLPVAEPERLYSIFGRQEKHADLLPISFPNYEDLRAGSDAFSDLAAYQWTRTRWRDLEPPQQLMGQLVTAGYFPLLGVELVAGRAFSPGDEDAVVLSQRLSERLFGPAPSAALGRSLTLDDHRYTVIGVVPGEFNGIGAMGIVADYWLPMSVFERVSAFGQYKNERGALLFVAIGRLGEGITPAAAFDELDVLARRLRREHPVDNATLELVAKPLRESVIDPSVRSKAVRGAWIAVGLAGLLFLVVGSNVWILQWVRALRESAEMATRRALGAGAGELGRQLLAESLLLAAAATAVGVLAARALASWLWRMRPPSFVEGYLDVGIDGRSILFAFVAATVLIAASSSVFLLRSTRGDLSTLMKAGGRGSQAMPLSLGLRHALVGLQVALAVVAAVSAGLFVRSLHHALTLDTGMDGARLLLVEYDLKGEQLEPDEAHRLGLRVVEAVTALPGVASASLGTFPPLDPFTPMKSVSLGGDEGEAKPFVRVHPVDSDHFRTTGISILRGRGVTGDDRSGRPPVAVVNRTMAERFWPGGDALGRRFRLGQEEAEHTVVGIAENGKYGSLSEEPMPYVYVALAQAPQTRATLFVRSRGTPGLVMSDVRDAVQRVLPRVPLHRVQTFEDRLQGAVWPSRMAVLASVAVGSVTWILAVVGVVGVVASVVRGRRREIAIRVALGGRPRQILPQVFRATLLSLGAGLVAGVATAAAVGTLLERLLFGVPGLDVGSALGWVALLAAVCLLAVWLPTRRALIAPPSAVLREE